MLVIPVNRVVDKKRINGKKHIFSASLVSF
jgi:hypothetical protein